MSTPTEESTKLSSKESDIVSGTMSDNLPTETSGTLPIKVSDKLSNSETRSLKVLWLEPEIQFNGKGIITVWREALEKRGWDITQDASKIDEVDIVFFGSDSQLRGDLLVEKPTICMFWGWLPERFMIDSELGGIQNKTILLRLCTRVLVPSPNTRDQLRMVAGIDGTIFPVGIDTDWIDSIALPLPINQRKPQIMFCSRLVPHKRLDMLLEAMSMIAVAATSINLIICGPGDRRPYTEYVSRFLTQGIECEFCEPDDFQKMQMMKESLLFVHPSEYEGWGLPPMEAIYNGAITLLLDTPHNRWVFKEGATYFYNAEDLAVNIVNLLTKDIVQQEALARTCVGRERIRIHGNLQVVCESLWAHFHQTIKDFLALELVKHPEKWAEIYDAEHRRNWAYGGGTSPSHACGPARFDPTWSRHWRAQAFIDRLKKNDAKHIIDIGCGPVYPTIFALEGFEVSAVDISRVALDQVMNIATEWGVESKIWTNESDAHNLPYADGEIGDYFDAAIIGELLEHVLDPENILKEAIRVVKPGGVIIASTPIGTHHYDPMHMNIFDDSSITELCEQARDQAMLSEITKVAEIDCDASCYLIVLRKK